MSESLIVAIFALLGSIVAIIVPLLKKPHEVKGIDAATVKTYAEAAKLSAERAEKSADEAEEKIEKLEKRIALLEEENEAIKDWAERLCLQVKSLGAVPVRMSLKKIKATD